MALLDGIMVVGILLGLFIMIYSKVKDQSMKDTVDEIKEVLTPTSIEPGIMP